MRKLTDHPIVVILGILSSVIAIFGFVTGISNLRALRSPVVDEPLQEPHAPPTSETAKPSLLVFATATADDRWQGALDVRRPTLNEIRAEDPASIWLANIINVEDLLSPGRRSYSGAVQRGREYLFPVYWCARDSDVLRQNMENMETVLLINEQVIPEKSILNYEYATSTGWKCSYHSVVLGGWISNASYKLEARRTVLVEVSDGQTSYAPGEYVYELTILAR